MEVCSVEVRIINVKHIQCILLQFFSGEMINSDLMVKIFGPFNLSKNLCIIFTFFRRRKKLIVALYTGVNETPSFEKKKKKKKKMTKFLLIDKRDNNLFCTYCNYNYRLYISREKRVFVAHTL